MLLTQVMDQDDRLGVLKIEVKDCKVSLLNPLPFSLVRC